MSANTPIPICSSADLVFEIPVYLLDNIPKKPSNDNINIIDIVIA